MGGMVLQEPKKFYRVWEALRGGGVGKGGSLYTARGCCGGGGPWSIRPPLPSLASSGSSASSLPLSHSLQLSPNPRWRPRQEPDRNQARERLERMRASKGWGATVEERVQAAAEGRGRKKAACAAQGACAERGLEAKAKGRLRRTERHCIVRTRPVEVGEKGDWTGGTLEAHGACAERYGTGLVP